MTIEEILVLAEMPEEMIKELKIYNLIEKKVNFNQIEQNLLKISELSLKYPNIIELDINPLMVNSESASVVDARISFD